MSEAGAEGGMAREEAEGQAARQANIPPEVLQVGQGLRANSALDLGSKSPTSKLQL